MTCMRLLEFIHGEGMGTSLLLLMNTLGLYIYIYIYRKSNALDKFIEFKAELDNLLGK